ncbi:MAG: hypothetical protein WCV90_01290 [Candidatus Woesearchaeota archaeon]|jgi:hypothetical protein
MTKPDFLYGHIMDLGQMKGEILYIGDQENVATVLKALNKLTPKFNLVHRGTIDQRVEGTRGSDRHRGGYSDGSFYLSMEGRVVRKNTDEKYSTILLDQENRD